MTRQPGDPSNFLVDPELPRSYNVRSNERSSNRLKRLTTHIILNFMEPPTNAAGSGDPVLYPTHCSDTSLPVDSGWSVMATKILLNALQHYFHGGKRLNVA